jgi:FixJ family two-component response regulator
MSKPDWARAGPRSVEGHLHFREARTSEVGPGSGAVSGDAARAALHSSPRVEKRACVAVIDDDRAVLRSFTRLLSVHGFDARPFSSAEALLSELGSFSPDCLIADLSMPGLTGLDLQRMLEELGSSYPIVFVTGHGDIRSSVQAMRRGAVDFLTKPFDPGELLRAVERAVSAGRRIRALEESLADARHRLASLSNREREVFEQVVGGALNKQIAASLGISEKTVKVHRARVMRKMSVRSVAQLARVAEQVGVGEITGRGSGAAR